MHFRSVSSTCIAALMLAAAVQGSSAGTIKIGVFGPMTGDAAAIGSSEKDAVDLAIQEKNDAGGIRGEKIEPIFADDGGKPEEAVNAVKRLISRDEVLLNDRQHQQPGEPGRFAGQPPVRDGADRGGRHRPAHHDAGK